MLILNTSSELKQWQQGVPTVFVPTMGALHAGHSSLIELAVREAQDLGARVLVSVFVNPAQFNDPTDLQRYPRELSTDVAVAERFGAEAVFSPEVSEIYPDGHHGEAHFPLPDVVTKPGLEDRFRPGHLEGVWLVLERLFDVVSPAVAVFGAKDWQQFQLAHELGASFSPRIRVVPGETVRDSNGLALSSRNKHLSEEALNRASVIGRSILSSSREATPADAEQALQEALHSVGLDPEYAVARDAVTLVEPRPGHPVRLLVACFVDGVRLIDNAPWIGRDSDRVRSDG